MLFFVTWKIHCGMPQKTWAERRPTRTIWLEEAQWASITAGISLSSLRSSTCSLADDPDASVALDPHLNIGLRKLAKRIQDFVKAVTPQSQQTNSTFHLNKETKSRQSRASPVTSRSNDKAGDSLNNTWHPKLKPSNISVKTRRDHVGWETRASACRTKASIQTKSLFLLNWWIDLYAETEPRLCRDLLVVTNMRYEKSATLTLLLTLLANSECVCVCVCLCFGYVFLLS